MFDAVAQKVRALKLTYLRNARLGSINACPQAVKARGVAGDFLEFGLALDGSGICIPSELDAGRAFVGLDVFGIIPPPGEEGVPVPGERFGVIRLGRSGRSGRSGGIGRDNYYGYNDNLTDGVTANFVAFGLVVDGKRIHFVKGLYKVTVPTLPPIWSPSPISIATDTSR